MKCVVIRQEDSQPSQFFYALAPEDCIKGLPATAGRAFLILLEKSWVYTTGKKPNVQVENVVDVTSSSTSFAMQMLPPQTGDNGRVRIIALEAKAPLDLTPLNSTQPATTLDEGFYMDVLIQSGGFGSFVGPTAWDPNNPPAGSTTLMATIDPERAARGIP